MNIYSRLRIVPATSTLVHKSTSFRAAIIRIFGIEDIVDLTQQTDIGESGIG
jgi:hypothetical protein